MKHKISMFNKRRDGNPATPTSPRIPWRLRRREEPRQASASQSDFNSLRVNTTDYRSLDLLRQYDDHRINVSSVSQPITDRDQRPPTSSSIELERCQSEERNTRPEQVTRRRQNECLFLTSGYRVDTKGSPDVREILSSTTKPNPGHDEKSFPFVAHSREDLFLRGKGCLLILFIFVVLIIIIGVSWYFSCSRSLNKGSVHANRVTKLLGYARSIDRPTDARNLWINHVVKSDDKQILIAETFESRLNAEVTPLLERYVDKIWDHASSPPITCHGGDHLMIAFSTAKSGSIPASITYETPCLNGPSSRSCVVKKQITDVRDLIVRLPSKSSRYMHVVRLEVDRTNREGEKNSSGVHHIQDLGTCSGQLRVELSDASRLALQRYCGQNRKAYSQDLMAEHVSASNTRLINVYELKRLHGLLSSQFDTAVSGSSAWDTYMLSTIVIDPLDHSRHSLTPVHVQQLLSHLRSITDSQTALGDRKSRSPHFNVLRPQEDDLSRHSATPSPQAPARNYDDIARDTNSTSQLVLPLLSPSPNSALAPSPSPAQIRTTPPEPSFNFQPPPSQNPATKEIASSRSSSFALHLASPADREQSASGDAPSTLNDDQTVNDGSNEMAGQSTTIDDEHKESTADPEGFDTQDRTKSDLVPQEYNNLLRIKEGEHSDDEAIKHMIPSHGQVAAESSERSIASQVNKKTEIMSILSNESPESKTRERRGSSAQIPYSKVSTNGALKALAPSLSTPSLPQSSSNILEQGPSVMSTVESYQQVQPNRLGGGRKQAENRHTTKSLAGIQRRGQESTLSRATTKQSSKDAGRSTTSPNSRLLSPTQMHLSPPISVSPPHSIQRSLLPNQEALRSTKYALSSAREGLSKPRKLNQFERRHSSSNSRALSPVQSRASTLYASSSSARRSPSKTQTRTL